MVKHIILTLIFILTNTVWSEEFRAFTSKEGRVITARIINFSSYTGKVQLERENGRKVWVDPEIFSSKDKKFIAAWGEKDSMPQAQKPKEASETDSADTKVKELTKTEVRNIAKQYKKAWEDHDYAAWSDLLYKEHRSLSESAFNKEGVKAIMLRSVEGHNVYIEYNIKLPDNKNTADAGTVGLIQKRHGWLQVLPDGKIKYTPILFKHPMDKAMSDLYDMFPFRSWSDKYSAEEVSSRVSRSAGNLERMGIPCFRYNVKTSESKRNDAFELILDWMIENYESWDETEPKISCPEDMFEEKLDRIKKIK